MSYGIAVSKSEEEVIVRTPGGIGGVKDYLEDLMDLDYAFLECVGHPKRYVLRTLVFHDENKLVFVDGAFLIPLIESGAIKSRQQMSDAFMRHASKLAESGGPAQKENFEIGQEALAYAYYALTQNAIDWKDQKISDDRFHYVLQWLHIADEFLDSLAWRHSEDVPGIEAELRTRHANFLEMMKEDYGVMSGEFPTKKVMTLVHSGEQYKEALSQWASIEMIAIWGVFVGYNAIVEDNQTA
ncbi:hypothetical protein P170DRAFT_477217 [Aspergillus steynii IBT 23096]|uniref:Uncharacterized protein n=1 Tax=Aspergillus steynii IBT 23096 TaxID=1392250 RepID=A0A2I2G0C4_9EURO|nr:uncharacterized protein P170DRAFT_477217 [Aspergillus steynii IBT 23096]PLB46338.1 hypothetical protein P170DRAFT_477217 [Aspergillus steynii IBT 23096]